MRSSKDGPQDIKNRKESKGNARKKQDSKEIFDDNWNNEQSLLNEQNEEHQQTLLNESSDEDEHSDGSSEQEQRLLNDIEEFEDEQKSDCYEKCKEQWKKTSLCKTIGLVVLGAGSFICYKTYQNWDRSLHSGNEKINVDVALLDGNCQLQTGKLIKRSKNYRCRCWHPEEPPAPQKQGKDMCWIAEMQKFYHCGHIGDNFFEKCAEAGQKEIRLWLPWNEAVLRPHFSDQYDQWASNYLYKEANIRLDGNRGMCIDSVDSDGNFKCAIMIKHAGEWLYENCKRSGLHFDCDGPPSHYFFRCELDSEQNDCWCLTQKMKQKVPYHCMMSDDKNHGLPVEKQLQCLQKEEKLMVCAEELSREDAQAIANKITICHQDSEAKGLWKSCKYCETYGPVSSMYCELTVDTGNRKLARCSPNVKFAGDYVTAHDCVQMEMETMKCDMMGSQQSCVCSTSVIGEEVLCRILDEKTWLKCPADKKEKGVAEQCREIVPDGVDFNKFITSLDEDWANPEQHAEKNEREYDPQRVRVKRE